MNLPRSRNNINCDGFNDKGGGGKVGRKTHLQPFVPVTRCTAWGLIMSVCLPFACLFLSLAGPRLDRSKQASKQTHAPRVYDFLT